MDYERDDLHDDLLAMLAAGRELPEDTHEQLVAAFIRRLEVERRPRNDIQRLVSVVQDLVPVRAGQFAGIAVVHGLVLFAIGKLMIDGYIGMQVYMWEYMRLWLMLGVIWVAEVVVTVATISVLAHRPEARKPARRRRYATE